MDRTRPTHHLNIVSANVDASIAFYSRLGVDISGQPIWRTPTVAEARRQRCRLMSPAPAKHRAPPPQV